MIWLVAACALAFGKWTYATSTNSVPAPSIIMAQAGDRGITETDFLADRMFTTFDATYDANLVLQSGSQSASCCGSARKANVSRNDDGSYDVTDETTGFPGSDYTEHLKNYRVPAGTAVVFGGDGLLPLLLSRHVTQVARVQLRPIGMLYETLESAHVDTPDGVPKDDAVLAVHSVGNPTNTRYVWYDPCTFTVDAWGMSTDATVRKRN